MLLKSADDKTRRLTLLGDLQQSPLITASQRKWLREEYARVRKGIQGERDSAHYIDSHFKDSPNHFVIHDLRQVSDGGVAQIDHMVINRAGAMFLLETKNYSGSLVINEFGEFTAVYDDERFGIESPIEQSRRHERILLKVLERLEIEGRTQRKLDVHHVAMVHPRAVIERPPASKFDTRNVIKADQFPTWHAQFVDSAGHGMVLRSILNIRSQETVREWAEKLTRQHRPADLLTLPDFVQPRVAAVATPAVAQAVVAAAPETAKRLVCATCGAKFSYPEGKFCWNNAKRFGGLQYCREHQAAF